MDALTEDKAVRFINALQAYNFEFRCILQVLITTGLRRGEYLGLQWTDIGRPGDPFEPRDPSAIIRHMKRFVKRAGLPDVSPHDLRHSCASLLLSSGADIKSVQEILGHVDASTTLNVYVKTDLKQMRSATEKCVKAFGL